jgi:YegS/Rv2252/BmrU family lipid kinase
MKLHVIINPRSKLARNERALAIIRSKFGLHLNGITQTARAQDSIDVARRVAKSCLDTVVVVGGDGTVNGVLDGLAGTQLALGIIPAGTANDLASLCDLPRTVAAACDVILRRRLRTVDLISINQSYFVTGGGLGLPSKVAAHADAVKRNGGLGTMLHAMLGSKLYVVSAISALLKHSYEKTTLAIRWDRGSLTADCLSLTVNNQPFVGRHFYVSPRADNNDGLFDVCLVENSRSRSQIAATLTRTLRGSHTSFPSVMSWRARELVVCAEKPLPFFADGEHLQTAEVFTIRIFPKSLNLIVPADEAQPEIRACQERNNHALYS